MQESCFLLRLPAVHAHTLKVRCASPSVSNHFRIPGFKRLTTVENCRSQPLAFAPPVSPNTWLFRQVRSNSIKFSSREQPQGACRANPPRQQPSATSDVSQLRSRSRIISPRAHLSGRLSAQSCNLGNPASSAVLRVPRGVCALRCSPHLLHCCCSGP